MQGLIGKRWLIPLIVILLIVLAVETTILVIIISQSFFGGRQVFPGLSVFRNVQPGCGSLTWSVQSTTANNRTILFSCPSTGGSQRGALVASGWSLTFPFGETNYSPRFAVIPTFTLPRGYLSLWLTTSPGDCSSAGQLSFKGKIPLISGKEIGVGGYSSDYDYCTVLDNSAGKIDGFTINWSNGTPAIWRPAPYTLTTSTSSVTVSAGQTANYTITATSLNGWTGNLSLAPYASGPTGGTRSGGPVNLTFVPSYVVVGPNGSNNTVLRVPTVRCSSLDTWCTPTGLYPIFIWAYWAQSCLASAPGGFCADGYNAASLSLQLNVT